MHFSDPVLMIFGTFAVHQIVFWIANGIIILLTYVIFPKSSLKYKIQKDIQVDLPLVKKCAKAVLKSQIFIILPGLAVACPLFMHLDMRWHIPFPPWYRIVLELFGFIGVTEIFFFYSHRMLHISSIYEYVHKRHHTFRAPISLTCEYAHPIEFIISNLGSVGAGPVVFRSHLLTTWIWVVIAILGTISHHSGYKLPGPLGTGLSDPGFHDFHHAQFNNNYGLLGILDRLHGTDKAWQAKKLKDQQVKNEKKLNKRM